MSVQATRKYKGGKYGCQKTNFCILDPKTGETADYIVAGDIDDFAKTITAREKTDNDLKAYILKHSVGKNGSSGGVRFMYIYNKPTLYELKVDPEQKPVVFKINQMRRQSIEGYKDPLHMFKRDDSNWSARYQTFYCLLSPDDKIAKPKKVTAANVQHAAARFLYARGISPKSQTVLVFHKSGPKQMIYTKVVFSMTGIPVVSTNHLQMEDMADSIRSRLGLPSFKEDYERRKASEASSPVPQAPADIKAAVAEAAADKENQGESQPAAPSRLSSVLNNIIDNLPSMGY
jgi:hypothetical protein